MITSKKLKDLAEIYSGYAFREAIETSSLGKTFVIQAKDVNPNLYILNPKGLIKTSADIPRSNSYLLKNDVLLTSRGSENANFKSTVFKASNSNVIASATLNIIRLKNTSVLPEYISIFLNSSEGQDSIRGVLSGSYIRVITLKNLGELLIPIPLLDKQRTIISIYENIRRQDEIAERKSQIRKNIINKVIKETTR